MSVCLRNVVRPAPDLSARQVARLLTVHPNPQPQAVRGPAATLDISKPAAPRALDSPGGPGFIRRARRDGPAQRAHPADGSGSGVPERVCRGGHEDDAGATESLLGQPALSGEVPAMIRKPFSYGKYLSVRHFVFPCEDGGLADQTA